MAAAAALLRFSVLVCLVSAAAQERSSITASPLRPHPTLPRRSSVEPRLANAGLDLINVERRCPGCGGALRQLPPMR